MESTEKMELVLLNPKEEGFLQHIEWNNAEIKERVEFMMSAYTDVVYTEDAMKQAKDDRAFLNKLVKNFDDRRKAVKQKCMEPYEQFEKEMKEVLEPIKKASAMIDEQIKGFEEQQKQQKKDKLEEVYREHIGDLAELFGFDRIFVPQYLNATYSLKKATEDIIAKIERINTDLRAIDTLCSKYKMNAKDIYIQTLDISKAMNEERRLRELEAKLEAERLRKEEEEERRKEEERKKQEAVEAQKQAEEAKKEQEPPHIRGCITGKNPNGTCSCCGAEGVKCCAECEEDCNGRCGWLEDKTVTKPEESVSKTPESVSDCEESVTEPVSPIGRAIAGIERQAFEVAVDPFVEKPKEKKYKATFCAVGTLEQLNKLTAFMKSEGIEYGKVGK